MQPFCACPFHPFPHPAFAHEGVYISQRKCIRLVCEDVSVYKDGWHDDGQKLFSTSTMTNENIFSREGSSLERGISLSENGRRMTLAKPREVIYSLDHGIGWKGIMNALFSQCNLLMRWGGNFDGNIWLNNRYDASVWTLARGLVIALMERWIYWQNWQKLSTLNGTLKNRQCNEQWQDQWKEMIRTFPMVGLKRPSE